MTTWEYVAALLNEICMEDHVQLEKERGLCPILKALFQYLLEVAWKITRMNS
jgi:hypothetical protein